MDPQMSEIFFSILISRLYYEVKSQESNYSRLMKIRPTYYQKNLQVAFNIDSNSWVETYHRSYILP